MIIMRYINRNYYYLHLCNSFTDDTFTVNRDLEVRMSIKPRVKTGVIFSVAKENMDYVSFEMVNGDVSIEFDLGSAFTRTRAHTHTHTHTHMHVFCVN